MSDEIKKAGIFFAGIDDWEQKPYPAWRYHELFEPVVVHNTEEDEQAAERGWKTLDAPITGVQHLVNWRHDLEDMTAEQLVLFAREEFQVDLPVEAGEEKLVKAMWRLTHNSPQHTGRVTLLAQTVAMDYDEIVSEIQAFADKLEIIERKEVVL